VPGVWGLLGGILRPSLTAEAGLTVQFNLAGAALYLLSNRIAARGTLSAVCPRSVRRRPPLRAQVYTGARCAAWRRRRPRVGQSQLLQPAPRRRGRQVAQGARLTVKQHVCREPARTEMVQGAAFCILCAHACCLRVRQDAQGLVSQCACTVCLMGHMQTAGMHSFADAAHASLHARGACTEPLWL